MAAPIWKDYTVNLDEADASLATLDAIDFEVHRTYDSSLIYTGRAYRRPGAAHVTLRLNAICAPFVVSPFPALTSEGLVPWAASDVAEFEVVALDGNGDGYTADTVQFVADWSYDPSKDWDSHSVTSAPINGRVSPMQKVIVSILEGDDINWSVLKADGTTDDGSDTGPSTGNIVVDLAQHTDPVALEVSVLTPGGDYDVLRFAVDTSCRAYVLYYRNAFGGWDSLLLDGTVVPADGYARKTTERVIDNSVQTARAKVQYLNAVTPRWALHTGWLKDDEVARLHHLTGTVEAYLCDLATGDLLPVNITDGEAVYHTLQTNGRRPVYFELNAELAQGRERR